MISGEHIKNLEDKARDIRISIIEMLVEAKSGHTAGPLGMSDIFATLYFSVLKHNPQNPSWEQRDLVVLSNGHICPVLYSTMAHAGYFPVEELLTLRKFGSRLQGHPHREWLPTLETSSGPLGSGLSQAVGMALALRLDETSLKAKSERFVYCFLGDGELNEGQNWEAILLAGKERLGNLIAIIDRNNIQIDGFTEDVMPLESLYEKWAAFNWHVIEINGHSFEEITDAFKAAHEIINRPTVIIAHTVPGKGVKNFEYKPEWHGKAPNKEEGRLAIEEIKNMLK